MNTIPKKNPYSFTLNTQSSQSNTPDLETLLNNVVKPYTSSNADSSQETPLNQRYIEQLNKLERIVESQSIQIKDQASQIVTLNQRIETLEEITCYQYSANPNY